MRFLHRARHVTARAQQRLDEAQERFNQSQRERAAAARAAEQHPVPMYDSAGRPLPTAQAPAPAVPPDEAPTSVTPALPPLPRADPDPTEPVRTDGDGSPDGWLPPPLAERAAGPDEPAR